MTHAPRIKHIALTASHAPSLLLFRRPLIEAIVSRGHDVLAISPGITAAIARELEGLGASHCEIPLSRTGLNPLSDVLTTRTLTQIFRARRPDIVMGYTPKPAIYASLAAARARIPRIVPMITGLGYAFLEDGGIKGRLIHQATKALYARAFAVSHSVIFHNLDDRVVLAEAGCIPPGLPTHVVNGSGVDLNHYALSPLPPLDQGMTFLMIARLVRYKGIAEYCAAAAMLKPKAPLARWLLIGPPETGSAGFPSSDLEKSGGAVTYLGEIADVRPHLHDAHVYVLPSYGEGMPRTVLEALAIGRPIITTDARGCRETVEEGQNGVLVPPGDAHALAKAMAGMLEHPDQLSAMGRESRQIAERDFDVRKVNAAMLEALGLSSGT